MPTGVYKRTEETKKKMGVAAKIRGNHRSGISHSEKSKTKIRNSIEYKIWIGAVFAHDGYTCQKIGIKGGHLVAHHIQNFAQFPELRFAIDNGITLSKQAHNEFHKRYGRKNNNREQLDEFLGDLKIKLTPQ